MLNIMFGALLQMLPVVIGVKFQNPKRMAWWVYIPLNTGIALFFISLYFDIALYHPAALLLLLSIGSFALLTLYKLFNAPSNTPTLWAFRLSLISLLIALAMGVFLLTTLKNPPEIFGFVLPMHALFAAFGWIALLIIGVSYQVIPMFYVTTEIDRRVQYMVIWLISGALTLLLLALITLMATDENIVVTFILSATFDFIFFLLLNFALFVYAVMTLLRLYNRKRSIKEPSLGFWYVGLFAALAASIYPAAMPFNHFSDNIYAVLFGYGFAISIIYGMLYKIIPFLSWFHISSRGFFDMPNMKEMVDERLLYLHLGLHLLSFALLILYPKAAAPFIIAENILFYINIKKAVKIYFEYKAKKSPFEGFSRQ